MKLSFHRTRPALSSQARWMPFELLVALRFLREGRMQSALILAGVTGGVAVIIFLTQLINQLQGTIIDKVLGSQAHVVIKPLEEATQRVIAPRADQAVAALVQPREQRLRSVDQWERIAALAAATPGVLAVSPVVSGPAFAARGNSNKSVVLLGVQPEQYRRVVRMDDFMTRGRFDVAGTGALIGTDLASDLGLTVGDKLRVTSATGRSETLDITGLFDMGNRDLNRRWVFVTLKLAQSLPTATASTPALSKAVVLVLRRRNRLLDLQQRLVRVIQIDFRLTHRRADVARDVQVEIVLLDLGHAHPARVARLFLTELVGLDDLGDVLIGQLVLALAFDKVLGRVDEQHVVRLLALLQHQDADRDAVE
jgi:hypothetical protein